MNTFSVLLVGCGKMGAHQAQLLTDHPDYTLAAVCDISAVLSQELAQNNDCLSFTDFGTALATVQPDVVVICTSNNAHATLCLQAAEHTVQAIYCEKPMAVNYSDAQAMMSACEKKNIQLIVNHQRRVGHDLQHIRTLITTGAIGKVQTIRAYCPGDLLSDGTHSIDNVLFLAGDPDITWCFGSIDDDGTNERYGHPIEDGHAGFFGTHATPTEDSIRFEYACGSLRPDFTSYQDLEIIGSAGSIRRCGDLLQPNVFINNNEAGELSLQLDKGPWVFHPSPDDQGGPWNSIQTPKPENYINTAYTRLAQTLRDGTIHPMNGHHALRVQEIIMALYESARLHQRIELPLTQMEFPLALMRQHEKVLS